MSERAGFIIKKNTSRARLSARRAGIKIEEPRPHLPVTEQEETDTM